MAPRFLSFLFRLRFGAPARLRRTLLVAVLFTLLTCVLYFWLLSNVEDKRIYQNIDSSVAAVDTVIVADSQTNQKSVLSQVVGSFRQVAAGYDPQVKKEMHAFYYAWYGNTTFDGKWIHWNHQYIPQPSNDKEQQSPPVYHQPPEDIGSTYYPLLGPYSSQDAWLVRKHMEWMRLAGTDCVVLSWYPHSMSDPNGEPVDPIVSLLLETADANGLKIAFHIEPFKGRDADSMHRAIAYLIASYGNHSALCRYRKNPDQPPLPIFYVYDSYLVPNSEWDSLLLPSGQGGHLTLSIRGTKNDAVIIGLCITSGDLSRLRSSGFDGAYTYFASNGMTECATQANWARLAARSAELGMLFIPSAGPGYDDTTVREWNQVTTRSRGNNGETLATSLKSSINAAMSQASSNNNNAIISLTSFNEWHEGTQIEPARPFTTQTPSFRKYPDYLPHDPFYYLRLTREIIENTWKHNGADQREKSSITIRPSV